MAGKLLPAIINQWTGFLNDDSSPMLGIADEIELTELEAIVDTLNGAGVMGELDLPATAQFAHSEVTIKWNIIDKDFFELMDTTDPPSLMFLAATQYTDPVTRGVSYKQVKIVIKGSATNINLGNLVKGKKGEPEITLGVSYVKIEIEGEPVTLELDKLNYICIVNGNDLMAPIRSRIGLS